MPPHSRPMLLLANACHPDLPEATRRALCLRVAAESGDALWLPRLRAAGPVGPGVAAAMLAEYETGERRRNSPQRGAREHYQRAQGWSAGTVATVAAAVAVALAVLAWLLLRRHARISAVAAG